MTNGLFDIQLKGLQAVKDELSKLEPKLRAKIARKALRKSANVVLAEAKSSVPVDSGKLRDSLRIKVSVGKNREQAKIVAGNSEAWYASLVEYGFVHTSHGARNSRKPTRRGRVEGRAFMRNAAEKKFQETVSVFEETVIEAVNEVGKTGE